MDEKCNKPMCGPLGTFVGCCELDKGHEGPCKVNAVSEQDMVDALTAYHGENA